MNKSSQKNYGSGKALPTKWAVALMAAAIGYAVLQPVLNRQFGWSLPSLASLASNEQARENRHAEQQGPANQTQSKSTPTEFSDESGLKYGYLQEIAPDDFLSPGGLRYTRGSEQGHRLKHLARHLEDHPSRDVHGVFYGDMPQVLRWLDDVYERAKSGAKGTKRKEERGRITFEAGFSKPIGYVGGKRGKREGNPEVRDVRLVVDKDRVITAFPF